MQPRVQRRVGLIAGSFNPPHAGHIDLATKAAEAAGLDHVFFFANSRNRAKRHELAPLADRRAMLALMIDPRTMSVLPPHFFADPRTGDDGVEPSFMPLIEALARAETSRCEVWMLRGSDYFDPRTSFAYPEDLLLVPHVIGLRAPEHHAFDYSLIEQACFVETQRLSSSEIRKTLSEGPAPDGKNDLVRRYVDDHGLYQCGARPPDGGNACPPAAPIAAQRCSTS